MKNLYVAFVFLMLFSLLTGCSQSDSVMISDRTLAGNAIVREDNMSDNTETDTKSHGDNETAGMESSYESSNVRDVSESEYDNKNLYVYVCGHVVNPGVYKLEKGCRICDALEVAGGIAQDGQPAALDQAKMLVDEQTIYVPGIDEEWSKTSSDGKVENGSETGDGSININTATRDQLITLPGIGESKADDIIRYREEHGKFEAIEEIMNIQGIKEGVFNKIKDRISI